LGFARNHRLSMPTIAGANYRPGDGLLAKETDHCPNKKPALLVVQENRLDQNCQYKKGLTGRSVSEVEP
jgi:hypothetical protein